MVESEQYVVRSASGKRIVGYVCFGLFSLMAVGFTVLVLLKQFAEEGVGFLVFGYGFLLCALFLNWLLLAFEQRPRVVVKGRRLICYPRWKAKMEIPVEAITARKTSLKTDNSALGCLAMMLPREGMGIPF